VSKARDLANAGTALTTVSATELGYLDGVTSAIQTQINAKQATVSGVNDTEIGYLDGVTSAIQTQINAQIPKSIVDAKGDIIAASAADTVARLAVGANDTVLTADSSTGTGLKWATPAAGGMTLISTTTLTGASVTLSSIPSTYVHLQLVIRGYRPALDGSNLSLRVNSDGTANRHSNDNTSIGDNLTFSQPQWQIVRAQDNGTDQSLSCVTIFDYTNTTTWKTGQINAVSSHSGTPTNYNFIVSTNFYNQTAAITSLLLLPSSGNFTSGTALLYGVK
jgi:hypothetical protein